jgi:hypothetical protein
VAGQVKRKVPQVLSVAAAGLVMALLGCHGGASGGAAAPAASVGEALRPEGLAAALRKLGGAHVHATTRIAIGAGDAGGAIDAVKNGALDAADSITTTTDVWLDRTGNYRIVESNDHDGGREVVLFGRDLNVALRYGKMIRRAAEEPEPQRLLQEALGGPWAAWEVAAASASIERHGTMLLGGVPTTEYRIARSDGAAGASEELQRQPAPAGLRAWRGTVALQALDGRVWLDDGSGAPMKCDLSTTFTGRRGDRPIHGTIEAHLEIDGAAATPPIAQPAAEELALRQRIIPEQKELLEGLGVAAAAAPTADGTHHAPTPPRHPGGGKGQPKGATP